MCHPRHRAETIANRKAPNLNSISILIYGWSMFEWRRAKLLRSAVSLARRSKAASGRSRGPDGEKA